MCVYVSMSVCGGGRGQEEISIKVKMEKLLCIGGEQSRQPSLQAMLKKIWEPKLSPGQDDTTLDYIKHYM